MQIKLDIIYIQLYIKLHDNTIYNIENVYEVSHTNLIVVCLVCYKKIKKSSKFPLFLYMSLVCPVQ